MACSVSHTVDEIKAMVQKQIEGDKVCLVKHLGYSDNSFLTSGIVFITLFLNIRFDFFDGTHRNVTIPGFTGLCLHATPSPDTKDRASSTSPIPKCHEQCIATVTQNHNSLLPRKLMASPVEGEGLEGTDDREETPPPLTKEQIKGHVSALKSLIKSHNQRNNGDPIRLDFKLEDTEVQDHGIDKGKEVMDEDKTSESLTTFKERWTVETGFIMGVPEVMRISSFMDSVKSPELAKRFSNKVPTTMNEMMERLDNFVRSEEAYARTELPKGEVDETHRRTGSDAYPANITTDDRASYPPLRGEYNHKVAPVITLDSLTKNPKEILATETQLPKKAVGNGVRVGEVESLSEGRTAEGKGTPWQGCFPTNKGNQCDQCKFSKRQEAKSEGDDGAMC
uniref:Reverse transcriptase domain-containing protein n=1 Tax=Tanacetum cinerariifolium TaxID=118510 RepID=A0A6L2MWA6_TANCI|nr:reverse transcriptase domain-containing protein [Tanacetum cinerariifolium]